MRSAAAWERALAARDQLLDQWLLACTPMERALTARWLLDPDLLVNREIVPTRLRQAQEMALEQLRGLGPG